jgi:site-specific DNA-methyltransferase (adenine-specific)
MKQINGNKQMTDVWRLPAIGQWEKTCGKHPTQKPLRLLTRLILASTDAGDWIFDPFCGSGTTGIAANLCGRRFAGIEQELDFCKMAKTRRQELESLEARDYLTKHIDDLQYVKQCGYVSEDQPFYGNLPFEK